ncbi:MAG: sugar transferase [Elusimicrobia bacterium]|nr:sugar transferase [Elusimicrobiota bacterium]
MALQSFETSVRPRSAAVHAPLMPPWLRHAFRTVLHLACDAVAIIAAYALAYWVRFHWEWWMAHFPITGVVPPWSVYQRILYAAVPLWIMIFWYSSRLYHNHWMTTSDRFLQILKGCVLATAATLVATYIYSRLEYSRMMLMLAMPAAAALVTLSHALVLRFDAWMSRHESALPVLLVGGGPVADEIKARIRARHPEARIHEIAELPPAERLERLLHEQPYFELILLRSSLPHQQVLAAAEVCDGAGVAFKMVPDLLELRLGEVQMDHSLGLPAYRIQHTSMTRLNSLSKRAFDLVFSVLLLAAMSIPLALICLLIKLDSKGPVFYRQRRYGYKGRIFDAYKFRTMIVGAESKVSEMRSLNSQGAFLKVKGDPRVTRVGHWLRLFSLDEFPQFINVLRGEMSVVGPRPLATTSGELEALEREFGATARKRLNILPGITGLWQVSGRSDVSSEQRFSLDLFYIEHWSLGLDLEIIIKTVPAMLSGKGAY